MSAAHGGLGEEAGQPVDADEERIVTPVQETKAHSHLSHDVRTPIHSYTFGERDHTPPAPPAGRYNVQRDVHYPTQDSGGKYSHDVGYHHSSPAVSSTRSKVEWMGLLNTHSHKFNSLGPCKNLAIHLGLVHGAHDDPVQRILVMFPHDYAAVANQLYMSWLSKTRDMSDKDRYETLKKVFDTRLMDPTLSKHMDDLLPIFKILK